MTESLLDEGNDLPPIDENTDYFAELVGDDKKFKDAKALAKGKYEADRFIAFKNKEFDALREDYLRLKAEYDGSASLKQLVDQLKDQQLNNNNTPVIDNQQQKPNTPSMDDVKALLEQTWEQREVARKREQNWNEVSAKARERFGNNYKSVLRERAEELGISEARVNQMAQEEPGLFLHTFVSNAQPQGDFHAPPRTTQRRDNTATQDRNWSYYEKMRVERPKEYWLPKTQKQMHLDAVAQGERFNDQGTLGN